MFQGIAFQLLLFPLCFGISCMIFQKRSQLVLLLCLSVLSSTASAQNLRLSWDDARWRGELSSMDGIPSTNFDRNRDVSVALVADYEMPFISSHSLLQRSTFSFRLRPLMYYRQDTLGQDLFALGGGIGFRIFQHARTHTGFYAEMAEELILHSEKFQGNSTHFNFLSQFGVGYQWQGGGFLGLRFQHASNARLGSANSGINTWGLFTGMRF